MAIGAAAHHATRVKYCPTPSISKPRALVRQAAAVPGKPCCGRAIPGAGGFPAAPSAWTLWALTPTLASAAHGAFPGAGGQRLAKDLEAS